ncbi:MAG: sodium/solute symporter [Lunatimonas sp.]|nr:sodium/solute symporter [Lunatimonas sp.]
MLLVLLFMLCLHVAKGYAQDLQWHTLPAIPDTEGFAGMYAGVSNDVLLVAGGANFPEKRPWEGGEKTWYNRILYLESPEAEWAFADAVLPSPLGYGVSVTYENTVLIVGGSHQSGHSAAVYGLRVEGGQVVVDTTYPDLPHPLANMAGDVVDGVVVVAGGQKNPQGLAESQVWMLDLTLPREKQQWVEGPALPGKSRTQAVAGVMGGAFYLFSGFHLTEKEGGGWDRHLLLDAYRFSFGEQIGSGTWERLLDLPRGIAAAPSPAFAVGASHLLIPGGIDAELANHSDPTTHPGFRDKLLAYHVTSGNWVEMGEIPAGSARVTVPTAFWKKQWVVPSGEKLPGVRSPEVFALVQQPVFGWLNWTSLGVYLALMLGIGVYFSTQERTTETYFLAGRKIPWWAAGLSIYGTQLSAITFMAIPVVVFATDWRLIMGAVMIVSIVPLVIHFYLPFFRRVNILTAYQYLERRFDKHVRSLGSVTFILMQLARMGVVLYLPAIAISSVTGMDILLCIGIMGVFSTLYTVLGGMEAVIWTDVIQVVVLLGGALTGLLIAVAQIDGGFGQVWEIGMAQEKFRMLEWGWDYRELVFWVAIIGFFFLNIISYTSDQVVIQRYLTVSTEKEAAKSLWTNGLITLPGILMFLGLGTVLYVFYLTNPQKVGSALPEELLPYYIVSELPAGVAGLVIAGIFAASMSSLDSSMNSISTAYISDIHRLFRPGWGDSRNLRLAKWLTVWIGFFGTMSAVWIALSNVGFVFDLFQKLLGMIGGALAGVFILGIFTQRASSRGALVGILAGTLITFLVSRFTETNGYLFGAVGVLSCVATGYVASLVLPDRISKAPGNTYKDLVKRNQS